MVYVCEEKSGNRKRSLKKKTIEIWFSGFVLYNFQYNLWHDSTLSSESQITYRVYSLFDFDYLNKNYNLHFDFEKQQKMISWIRVNNLNQKEQKMMIWHLSISSNWFPILSLFAPFSTYGSSTCEQKHFFVTCDLQTNQKFIQMYLYHNVAQNRKIREKIIIITIIIIKKKQTSTNKRRSAVCICIMCVSYIYYYLNISNKK